MEVLTSEKIRILLKRRNMTVTALAIAVGTTRQNLSNKFSRDNFSEKELKDIAKALNCDYISQFVMNDTGETI